ncbi:MAG: MotA/TolQ/ExbB proton channel family protein [Akkermansia sp.]
MNISQNISDFFMAGGIFMYPLLICSIIVIAVIVHRLINVRRSLIMPPSLVKTLEDCLQGKASGEELQEAVRGDHSPLARLVDYVLSAPGNSEQERRVLIEARAKEEFIHLQAGLPLLDMIIMIAPMFGILGTASGLVIVFASFGVEDNQGAISQGIANALNTTIAGLAIATPAVMANIWFSRRLEQTLSRMEMLITELISWRFKVQG